MRAAAPSVKNLKKTDNIHDSSLQSPEESTGKPPGISASSTRAAASSVENPKSTGGSHDGSIKKTSILPDHLQLYDFVRNTTSGRATQEVVKKRLVVEQQQRGRDFAK